MRTAPENWDSFFSNANHVTQYQIIVSEKDGTNPHTYGMEVLRNLSLSSALLSGDVWIGNVISKTLNVSLLSSVSVPRMAKIVVNVRLGLNEVYTEYVPVGTFWVDERDTGRTWTTFTAYDAMLMLGQQFVDSELENGEWPITMAEAVAEVCTRVGITLDSRTTINTGTGYVVSYTNDLTMREVLGYIGAAHGGNWTITAENQLRLIPVESPSETPEHLMAFSAKTISELGEAYTISMVTLSDDSDNSFTAGDGTGHSLDASCLYASAAIVNDLCGVSSGSLYGVTYMPFSATSIRLNPL